MDNKIHCNQGSNNKGPQILVLRKLSCTLTSSFRQIRLNDILWMLWVPIWGAYKIAETSLNAVSNDSCYQDYHMTVWLWAIFPPSMWQRCNGTSVCRHCNCFSSSLKLDHLFPPESDVSHLQWFSHRWDWFHLIWSDCDCSKWVQVCNTWLWLTNMNTKCYLLVNSSIVPSVSCAKSHLLCKLCQCCQHCNAYTPFS